MERDPKTGRFLPGNKAAVGNRGNTNPKWGNKNALKHGFFATHQLARITKDGELEIFTSKGVAYRVAKDYFCVDELGRVRVHDKVSSMLKKMGVRFEVTEDVPEEVFNIENRNGKKVRKYTSIGGAYHW